MNLLLCLAILAAVVVIWCTVPALWVVCIAISALSWKEPQAATVN